MSDFASIPVRIFDRSNADKAYDSSIQVQSLNGTSRLMNGLKALGLSWLIAAGCIFIPVMHFFLVPGMFLVGIFLFFRRSGLREYRRDFDIDCPNCKTKIAIKRGPFNWPIREMCLNCRADAVIEPRS